MNSHIYMGSPNSQTLENIEEARRSLLTDDTSISWGLAGVDKKIGPPRPGQLIIVGARAGNGKTTFLLNMLIRVHNGMILSNNQNQYRTCYLGTEMVPAELLKKWAALYLGYDEDLVLSNKWHALPENARKNVMTYFDILEGEMENSWLPRCLSPTIEDVLLNINTAVEWGADIIIFDHLHRLQTSGSMTERETLQAATTALKTAATEHGILVLASSQLKREEHGVFDRYRPPHLGSFMGSSSIEGNADIAVGLYRPLQKMTVPQERAVRNGDLPIDQFIRRNTMALKCVKHRTRGSVTDTTVLLTINGGRIDDWANDEWEDINREDQHAGNIPKSGNVSDVQHSEQLPADSEGAVGRTDKEDGNLSCL